MPAVEPVILRQNGVGVLRGREASGRGGAFAEWALGPGQKAYSASRLQVRPEGCGGPDGEFRAIDEERLAKERDRWTKAWAKLIALGEQRPDG